MGLTAPLIPTPRTWATNDKATAALMNANARDPVTFLQTPPIFALGTTATTSIPGTGVFTAVNFGGTPLADSYGGWSVSNPSRYTCQVAGWYWLSGVAQLATNATGRRATAFTVNGNTASPARQLEQAAVAAGAATAMLMVGIVQLAKNDYVEFRVWQNSGSTLNAGGVAGQGYFVGQWIHA